MAPWLTHGLQLLVVKLGLFQGPAPDFRRALTINLLRGSGVVFAHAWNDLAQALHDVLERVHVIVRTITRAWG